MDKDRTETSWGPHFRGVSSNNRAGDFDQWQRHNEGEPGQPIPTEVG